MACQLDYLCELPTDRARRRALGSLPPSLHETYERILQRVNQRDEHVRTLVRRTLCWTLFTKQPINIITLQEALSIAEDLTAVDPSNKPDVQKILKYCNSLIRKSIDGNYLEIAHFTVEEFLCRSPNSDFDTTEYQFSPGSGDLHLAEMCLRYLRFRDFSQLARTYEEWKASVEKYPFRKHAVKYWFEYAHGKWEDESIMYLTKQLFQPTKTRNLLSLAQDLCVSIFEQFVEPSALGDWPSFEEETSSMTMHGISPLHLAAMLRVPPLVRWLLKAGCDPNQMSRLGSPLLCAMFGNISPLMACEKCDPKRYATREAYLSSEALETARILIEAGTKVQDPSITISGRPSYSYFSVLSWYSGEGEEILELFRSLIGPSFEHAHSFTKTLEELLEVDESSKVLKLVDCFRKSYPEEQERAHLLQVAALSGSSASLQLLTNRNNVQDVQKKHSTSEEVPIAFRVALRLDFVDELRKIIQSQNINLNATIGSEKELPLHLAAGFDSLNCVILLLESGANADKLDAHGRNALHHCASGNGSAVMPLLDEGVKMEQADALGKTVFHAAASMNNIKVLKALLADCKFDRAYLVQRCSKGLTPLLEAAKAGAQEALVLLTDFTDDFTLHVSNDGLGIAQFAAALEYQILISLLGRNIDVTMISQKGWTLLHYCCMKCKGETLSKNIEKLCGIGISPDSVDASGNTALQLPLKRKDWFRTVEDSPVPNLATPCTTTVKDKTGWTALHSSLRRWNPFNRSGMVIKDLLDHTEDATTLAANDQSCFDILLTTRSASLDPRYHGEDCLRRWNPTSKLLMELLHRIPLSDEFPEDQLQRGRLLSWAMRASQDLLLTSLLQQTNNVELEVIEDIFEEDISVPITRTLLAHIDEAVLTKLSSKSGHNLLHVVCSMDSQAGAEILDLLLAAGANPNALSQPQKLTCLILAAIAGKRDHARILLEHKALVNISDPYGWTAVHHAASFGRTDVLKLFASFTPKELQRSLPGTLHITTNQSTYQLPPSTPSLLHLAYQFANTIEYIIQEIPTSEVDCQDDYGQTALHLAAFSSSFESVRALVSSGADVNVVNQYRESVLHLATPTSSYSLVNFLLDAGADMNAEDAKGRLPIHHAASSGNNETVRALLEYGSKLYADHAGATPELCAMENDHPVTSRIIRNYMKSNQGGNSNVSIINSGANFHIDLDHLKNPRSHSTYLKSDGPNRQLIKAIKLCSIDLVDEILGSIEKLDCGYKNWCGCTPVILAVRTRQVDIAQFLFNKGLSTSGRVCLQEKNSGYSSIHLALMHPSFNNLVELLLTKEPAGDTHLDYEVHPLHVAVAYRNHDGLRLLIQHYLRTISHEGAKDTEAKKIFSLLNHRARIDKPSRRLRLFPTESHKIDIAGATPLHIAAAMGDENSARILLGHGAAIDPLDEYFSTPLHAAAMNSRLPIVKLLLHHGANPQRRDDLNSTVAMIATHVGNLEAMLELEKFCPDFSVYNLYGESYISLALRSYRPQKVAFFLDKDIQASTTSTLDSTCLDSFWLRCKSAALVLNSLLAITKAEQLESLGISKLLHRRKVSLLVKVLKRLPPGHRALVNINSRGTIDPRTPLYLATISGRIKSIEALIRAGAVVDLESCIEDNPLIAACQAGRLAAVKFLVRYASMQASTDFMGTHDVISASKHFPEIREWLLRLRWVEQKRLVHGESSPEQTTLRPWSGLERRGIPLVEHYGRYGGESMFGHAVALQVLRRDLLGSILCWDTDKPYPYVVEI